MRGNFKSIGPVRAIRYLCLFLLFLPLLSQADSPTLEVNANRTQVYLGESLLIEVKEGGADNPTPPDLSAIKNCTVEFLGSQSSSRQTIIIINGQMRREGFTGRTFTYKLTPTTEGDLEIGPVRATVAGNTLVAAGPTITVTGITRQDTVAIAVSASRDTVLVDEPFTIRLAVKIRSLPGRHAGTDPLFQGDPPHIEAGFLEAREIDGLKGPEHQRVLNDRLVQRNQPGFSINNYTVQADLFDFSAMMNPQGIPARFKLDRRAIEENGKSYWEYSLELPYTPLAEGAYNFGPVIFKGNIPVSVNEAGEGQGTQIFAVGPAAMVRVVPPPEKDRPDSYIGAIGSNLVAEAALDAQSCNVGDPLTLTLTISGAVQMRNITPPKLSLQPSLLELFEIYDDTVQTTRMNGQCQYAYTLRPRHSGSFELPPIEVSFYDVRTRQYHTVKTLPIPLKVRQAAEVTAAQIIGGSTNTAIQLHHAEESAMIPAGLRSTSAGMNTTPLSGPATRLIGLAIIGPLVFFLTLTWVLIGRHRASFATARRQRFAYSRARSALKSGQASLSHHALCTIMRTYLADRFSIPADALTPSESETLLQGRGIPVNLSRRFTEVMQIHFDAAFETVVASSSINTTDVEAALSAIERHLSNVSGKKRSLITPLLLLTLGATLHASAATPAERAFIWEEAMTGVSAAKDPKEFLAAARAFQKLVDLGVRNPALFYNQGTALLLADKPADAIAVLLRAERYGGSEPDIRRNLAIAQARKDGQKTPVTSWLRWVLFWHYGLDCGARAGIATGAFSVLWLAGALLILGARRTGKALGASALIVLVIFGSSVLTTLQQESRIQSPASILTTDTSPTP